LEQWSTGVMGSDGHRKIEEQFFSAFTTHYSSTPTLHHSVWIV
jgi:hypothetical protein